MPRQTQSYEDNENYLLLSKVSHEIRNPVALINSFLQLLAVNHPELKDDNCFLKIEENMDFLKGLLDELSTYNHSHTANMEDVNPYLLLQDLTASAAALLESQGIELQLTKETAVPRIPIDKIKFQQLISNLIRNAAESMPDGGTIQLLGRAPGDPAAREGAAAVFEDSYFYGGLTTGQIKLIHRFTNNVTILYDGDAAGIKASIRGIDLLLEEGLNIKVLLLPDGEDPDSFSRKQNASEFIAYVEAHQTDFIRFKTNLLLDEAGHDPIKRAGLIQDVVKSIAIIPNNIVRQVYIKDCSTLLDINEEVLVNAINKINRQKKEEQNKPQEKTANDAGNEIAKETNNDIHSEAGLLSGSVVDTETRNLLKVLVRYGERVLFTLEDGSIQTVGEFILQELEIDHIVFENPLYNEFIEEYRQHQHDTDFVAEKHFKFHPNSALSQLAINLITEKYTLSKIHYRIQVSENAKIKEVEIPTDADRLYELLPRLVLELKDSLLKEHIKQTLLKIKHACEQREDMSKIKELMDYCDALNAIKRDLSKSLGERVINKL